MPFRLFGKDVIPTYNLTYHKTVLLYYFVNYVKLKSLEAQEKH